MSVAVAPFVRQLQVPAAGRDVTAVKRALRRWRLTAIGNTTRVYGPGARRAVELFQAAEGLRVDGVYGVDTHRRLAPFFDAYGVWLLQHTRVVAPPSPRARVVAAAVALYNYQRDSGRVHYAQDGRRLTIVRLGLNPQTFVGHSIYEDCSSSVTGYFYIAKLPDPNGYASYAVPGARFTGTLAGHGRRVQTAYPGDLLFCGEPPDYEHVFVAVGDRTDRPATRGISHGSEGGPRLVALDYRPVSAIMSYF